MVDKVPDKPPTIIEWSEKYRDLLKNLKLNPHQKEKLEQVIKDAKKRNKGKK